MSQKVRDEHNRWRSKNVTFRMSPEENQLLETFVRLSGLTKQDYITKRLLCKDVVVQGNPRVYKALKEQLADILADLKRTKNGEKVDDELLDVIRVIAVMMEGMGRKSNGLGF